MKSVQGQLEAFKAEMERDGKAQQSECKKVIAIATKRAQNLVDSTLQVSYTAELYIQKLLTWMHDRAFKKAIL